MLNPVDSSSHATTPKIIEPIQSRCAVFRFRPLEDEQVADQVRMWPHRNPLPSMRKGSMPSFGSLEVTSGALTARKWRSHGYDGDPNLRL